MTDSKPSLYRHLRSWRKALKITQENLAYAMGVKANTVSGWETGARTPDLKDLEKLSRIYGVPPTSLLTSPGDVSLEKTLAKIAVLLEEISEEDRILLVSLAEKLSNKIR